MTNNKKSPYYRDTYLAYLINGAKRTKTDNYPIIEEWMVSKEPPIEITQWDRRFEVKDPSRITMSFYCNDLHFQPILNNPDLYTEKLRKYASIIGLDASPFDNMPLWVQKSQIGLNLALTYYYGLKGIKIIPNLRLGDFRTFSSLEAYPKNQIIAIGTNGFIKNRDNHEIFKKQIEIAICEFNPRGICIYGSMPNGLFSKAIEKNIPLYQYDSYIMKRATIRKNGFPRGNNQ